MMSRRRTVLPAYGLHCQSLHVTLPLLNASQMYLL